jgi:hypothetical protein
LVLDSFLLLELSRIKRNTAHVQINKQIIQTTAFPLLDFTLYIDKKVASTKGTTNKIIPRGNII